MSENLEKKETKEAITDENLNKALNGLNDLMKSKMGKEEKKEKEAEKKEDKKEAEKSFAETVKENETIKKSVEVSDFLKDLVDSLGTHVDGIRSDISKSVDAQAEISKGIIVALTEIVKSVDGLMQRTTELEKTPETKKSITATGVERGFAKSGEEENKKLSRDEVCQKLTDAVMMNKSINGQEVTLHDVNKFEATGQMRDSLRKAILQ